jgi:hypothetical protein
VSIRGLIFVISSADLLELQIRMYCKVVFSAITLPKSMTTSSEQSQQPWIVETEMLATGAVDAEPVNIISLFPPVVQN